MFLPHEWPSITNNIESVRFVLEVVLVLLTWIFIHIGIYFLILEWLTRTRKKITIRPLVAGVILVTITDVFVWGIFGWNMTSPRMLLSIIIKDFAPQLHTSSDSFSILSLIIRYLLQIAVFVVFGIFWE